MSFTTKFHDPSERDIGDIFVDLCYNQTIYGTKTFITTPVIPGLVIPIFKEYDYNTGYIDIPPDVKSEYIDIPPDVKYCDIEICGGGGGGGAGGQSTDYTSTENTSIIYGGAGGAGGTYYKLSINITEYIKYKITYGSGGEAGTTSTPYGGNGSSSIIQFYDNNNMLSYEITAGGGKGGERGKKTFFKSNFNNISNGTNLVYNNNGSVYKFSTNITDIISNTDSNSYYNQPSGGGGGGSVILINNNSSEIIYNNETLVIGDNYGIPGLNGGSLHLTNNESSICSIGSSGGNYILQEPYNNGNNGVDSSFNNPFSGGGGGSYGGYVSDRYDTSSKSFIHRVYNYEDSNTMVKSVAGIGGNGYKGGGGGGGGALLQYGNSPDYTQSTTGGNGGRGGFGFVKLYFY
jgi:hypothetical protein